MRFATGWLKPLSPTVVAIRLPDSHTDRIDNFHRTAAGVTALAVTLLPTDHRIVFQVIISNSTRNA